MCPPTMSERLLHKNASTLQVLQDFFIFALAPEDQSKMPSGICNQPGFA